MGGELVTLTRPQIVASYRKVTLLLLDKYSSYEATNCCFVMKGWGRFILDEETNCSLVVEAASSFVESFYGL